jgi:hypothetical protein
MASSNAPNVDEMRAVQAAFKDAQRAVELLRPALDRLAVAVADFGICLLKAAADSPQLMQFWRELEEEEVQPVVVVAMQS